MSYRFLFVAVPLVVSLAACRTPSAPPQVAGSAVLAAPPSAPRATLASEQLRLAELFRGTPVAFSMQADGSLRVTVPRRFSFDAGTIKVKPPLAAVLERLAKGPLQSSARMRVSAPSDPDTRGPTLARERALSVRDHLAGHGIDPSRLQASGAAQFEQVEIVVSDAVR